MSDVEERQRVFINSAQLKWQRVRPVQWDVGVKIGKTQIT